MAGIISLTGLPECNLKGPWASPTASWYSDPTSPSLLGFNTARCDASTAYADALARDRAFVNPDIELMVMTYGSENLDFASAEQAAWP
jgi:hypothetical protein